MYKNITIENIKENVAKLIKAYVKNGGHAIKGGKVKYAFE